MNIFSRFKGSRFVKNASQLIAGNIASQIVSVIAIPILTRVYTAEDFGVFASTLSVIGIVGAIASLKYEIAIPLPFSDRKASNIFFISLFCLLLTSLIFSLLLFAGFSYIEKITFLEQFENVYLIIPIGILIVGASNIVNYCVLREKTVSLLAKSLFLGELIKFAMQIMLAKLGETGMVAGSLFGTLTSIVYLLKSRVVKSVSQNGIIKSRNLKKTAVEYAKFPKYSTPASFINVSGKNLPNLFILFFYGAEEAGLFFLANKVLSVIISVSGVAVSHSFLIEAVEKERKDDLFEEVKKTVNILLFIIIIPIIIISTFGEEIVIFLSGEAWVKAGDLLSILSFIITAQFVASPVSQVLSIKGKLQELLFLQLVLAGFKILGLGLGYFLFHSFYSSVVLYSIFGSFGYLLFLKKTFDYSKNK